LSDSDYCPLGTSGNHIRLSKYTEKARI